MSIDFSKLIHEGKTEIAHPNMRDDVYKDAEALAALVRYCFEHRLTLTINPYRNVLYDDVVVRFDKTIGDKTYAQAADIRVAPTMGFDPDDFLIKQTCHQVLNAIEHDLLNKYAKEDQSCTE